MKTLNERPNQTKTPNLPMPTGSIHGFGWHILRTLKKHHSAYTTPVPQGSGLLLDLHLLSRTPHMKQTCPLRLHTSEQDPGLTPHGGFPTITHSCWLAHMQE